MTERPEGRCPWARTTKALGKGQGSKGGGDEKNMEKKVRSRETCGGPAPGLNGISYCLMFSVRHMWSCARTEREKAYV